MTKLFTIAVISLTVGCTHASITPMTDMPAPLTNCTPTLYSDKASAEKAGLTQEVCLIRVQSSSLASSIEAAKPKICECGTNKAFIKSTGDGNGWTYSSSYPSVILVGFK